MTPPEVSELADRTSILTGRFARGIGVFIFVASLLCIWFAATFPFDFSIPAHGAWAEVSDRFDWRWNPPDAGHVDRIENLLLFMPLGFGAAALIRRPRYRKTRQFLFALILGFILTSTVEILQTFISFRDPSMADIWCNTVGGIIGAIIFMWIGLWSLHRSAKILLWLRPLATPQLIGAMLAIYALVQMAEPLIIHNPGDLSNWDPHQDIAIGNNIVNNRSWGGKISQLVLADKAATTQQADQIIQHADVSLIFGDSLLANYRFGGAGPFEDLAGHLPPLLWHDKRAPILDRYSAITINNRWLQTHGSIEPAIDRIARSSQFTLVVTCSTDDPGQHGPARIISIADQRRDLDLELGQEFPDIALRIRTGVKFMPEMRLHNIFTDKSTHQILVTIKNAYIVVYVDGKEKGAIRVTPEAKVIWRLYPRGGFVLRMEQYAYRSYATIYRLFVYIPFSALLAAMLAVSGWNNKTRRIVAISILCGMAIALEIILGIQAESGFQIAYLLISLVIGFGALGMMRLITKILIAT